MALRILRKIPRRRGEVKNEDAGGGALCETRGVDRSDGSDRSDRSDGSGKWSLAGLLVVEKDYLTD